MARGLLVDLCVDIVKLVSSLATAPPTDDEGLHRRFGDLVNDFQTAATRAGYAGDSVEHAKYALVALVDERVMSLDGEIRDRWLASPMQMRLFGSFNAGEEFYTRMAQHRNPSTPERADVLEIFHLALCLGFKGKYADPSSEAARLQIIEQASGEIRAARGGVNVPLSPAWQSEGAKAPSPDLHRWLGMPIWAVPVLVVVVLLLWWVAGDFIAESAADRLARIFPAL